MPARHGLAVASAASSAAVPASARADLRAGLLPGAAEHVGAAGVGGAGVVDCNVQASPTELLPIAFCAAGLPLPVPALT